MFLFDFNSDFPNQTMKMVGNPRRTVNINVREFENFLEGWLVRQEHFLEELRSTLRTCDQSSDEDLRDLIARLLVHYQQYYEEKSRIANHDVSLVFSPPWFSPMERSFFWIAGFKPGLAFRIAGNAVNDMSADQMERMERLKAETKAEERELETELARVQETVASPPIIEIARRREVSTADGHYERIDSAMEMLRSEMEVVLANADMLRTRTAERVVEILSPVQKLKFLTAATELQLKVRMWGWQMEADRER